MGARRDELTDPAMDAAIERACVILRLPTIRQRYGEVAGIAGRQQASYKGFLTELLSLECDDRETRRKGVMPPLSFPPTQNPSAYSAVSIARNASAETPDPGPPP